MALTNSLGKSRPDNQSDLSLLVPMLSTDAGTAYYYAAFGKKPSDSQSPANLLAAVIADALKSGTSFGVKHVDSWLYPKGGNCQNPNDASATSWTFRDRGMWKLIADPQLFEWRDAQNPEAGFAQDLGPLMVHTRWEDDCNPYHQSIVIYDPVEKQLVTVDQPISGRVVTSLALWRQRVAGLKASGMLILELDWLEQMAHASSTFGDQAFLMAVNQATSESGIIVQYCMPVPRYILQAFGYDNVHTIRSGDDRFSWEKWDQNIFNSLFLNSGGIWPSVDNFRTPEKRNLLLAVLSAGPLPLGDLIGKFVPISEAIRTDSVVVKPDVSLVPTDLSFLAEARAVEQYYGLNDNQAPGFFSRAFRFVKQLSRDGLTLTLSLMAANDQPLVLPPLMAHTYSDFGSTKAEYVFAYSRDFNATAPVSFTPTEFGFVGDVYVYDYFQKVGQIQPATQAINRAVDSQGNYFIIVPVGQSKIAFLGDLAKYAALGRQRIISLSDNGQVNATVQFALNEAVNVSFFAPAVPLVWADMGAAGNATFDPSTGLYSVAVSPGPDGKALIHVALSQ